MTKAEKRALEAYPDDRFVDYTYADMCRGFFKEGYEQAEKDLGWHSVDDCLPEVDEEVIVLTNRVRDIELDSANRICFAHIVDKSLAIDWDGWNIPGVKYWMSCPKLKEEEQ